MSFLSLPLTWVFPFTPDMSFLLHCYNFYYLYLWQQFSPFTPERRFLTFPLTFVCNDFTPFTSDIFPLRLTRFFPSFVYNDFTPFISNMKSLSLTLTRSFSLHPWHKFMKSLPLTRTRSYSLYLYHEVSFLPLTWDFFLTSDMSLKLASSFSLSCCRSLMFCSCMSSNAWPVTSISLSRASSLCTITLIGRTKNIMQQNEFWTAHLLKNHKRL